jgi:hypothetical protein
LPARRRPAWPFRFRELDLTVPFRRGGVPGGVPYRWSQLTVSHGCGIATDGVLHGWGHAFLGDGAPRADIFPACPTT